MYILQDGREVQFSIHQVILAITYDSTVNGEKFAEVLHSVLPSLKSTHLRSEISRKQSDHKLVITEFLHHCDPRTRTQEAEAVRTREIENLVRRGTLGLVLEEDLPDDANMITGSFVLTIKDVETETPTFRARFVAHGNRDAVKNQLIHDSTTARQSSVAVLVLLASVMGFDVWTDEISQVYLKSASSPLREIYLRANRQLKMPAGYVLNLLGILYGLVDSGDYWHATFAKHLANDLNMKPGASDVSLFFRRVRRQVCGLLASYMDGSLSCGDRIFIRLTEKKGENFEIKDREYEKCASLVFTLANMTMGLKFISAPTFNNWKSYLKTLIS